MKMVDCVKIKEVFIWKKNIIKHKRNSFYIIIAVLLSI